MLRYTSIRYEPFFGVLKAKSEVVSVLTVPEECSGLSLLVYKVVALDAAHYFVHKQTQP